MSAKNLSLRDLSEKRVLITKWYAVIPKVKPSQETTKWNCLRNVLVYL